MKRRYHKSKLVKVLKSAGLYVTKLEPQIEVTATQLELLDSLLDELSNGKITYTEKSAAGFDKLQVNPLLANIQKLQGQITSSYKALGLNFNAKADNLKESTDQTSEDPLQAFLEQRKITTGRKKNTKM